MTRRNSASAVAVVIVFLAAAGLLHAGDGNVVKGKTLYANLCIRCHGVEGKGDGAMTFTPPVADLTAPAAQNKLDATLLKTIHDGKKNTAMGAWKFVLTEEEMRAVTAYVRQLGSGIGRSQP